MGEKICAICCGREREVTIDCPLDCSYLIAAHRYEAEHRKLPPPEEYPYKDVEFSVDFVYEHGALGATIGRTIVAFQAAHRELDDASVQTALERLAETYRTLGTGIYYERPPEAQLPLALYGEIQRGLNDLRKAEAEQTGFSSVKDSDIFKLLVFFLRILKTETNGRRHSRAFLQFVRTRFPLPPGAPGAISAPDAPRIIIP